MISAVLLRLAIARSRGELKGRPPELTARQQAELARVQPPANTNMRQPAINWPRAG